MLKALEHNKCAFEFNKQIFSDVSNFCNTFLNQLGITTFRYMKMYNDFTYLSIGTNLDYLKYYLQYLKEPGKIFEPKKIYSNPILIENNSEFCYFLWPSHYSKSIKDPLYNILYKFDIWHGFTVSRKGDDYVETWSFASSKSHTQMADIYINNLPFLNFFISQFCNMFDSQIKAVKKKDLAIFENPFNLNVMRIIPETKQMTSAPHILKSYMLKKDDLMYNFSTREIECLVLLSRGQTTKMIGAKLNISPRTVETYIESVKQKTNVSFKSELATLIPLSDLPLLNNIIEQKYSA